MSEYYGPVDPAAAPRYWLYETSGKLRPAVEAYLAGGTMTPEQIAAMRAYLRQWIMAPVWANLGALAELRAGVDGLTSRAAIAAWIDAAMDEGVDPL